MNVTDGGFEKDPEVSLLDGISLTKTTTVWQLYQHATRLFLVMVAIEQTPARSHYGQKIKKETDTHTTTHKLTKSGFCNTKKRNRIILLRSKSRNFAQ